MTTPQELAERALAAARRGECVVIADQSSTANLRWAGNTLTTDGVGRSTTLTVIATRSGPGGVCAGVASASAVSLDQVAGLVEQAENAAAQSPPAEDAEPLLKASAAAGPAEGAGWDDPPAVTGIGTLGPFARGLGEAFGAATAGGRLLYGFAEHTVTSTFLGSSTGLRLRHDQPAGSVELTAKSAADLSRSAWTGTTSRDFADVDAVALEAGLARQLGWAQRRIDLPPGRYETLLPPTAVADLMAYMFWSAGARDAAEGRTVFSAPGGGNRIGERLASVPVSLRGDPAEPAVACPPFVLARTSSRESSVFDNGLPLARTEWISGGTLTALTQTRSSARRTGGPVTPWIDNVILDVPGAAGDLAGLVAQTRRGLLLTSLYYIREVDPRTLLLTGLTRDGVYLVQDGEVVGAVNNFRFNESPVALLGRITAAGGTELTLAREFGEFMPRTKMPPLAVADFNMSSVSQAS
jgi:predicted Zn-dependent protease